MFISIVYKIKYSIIFTLFCYRLIQPETPLNCTLQDSHQSSTLKEKPVPALNGYRLAIFVCSIIMEATGLGIFVYIPYSCICSANNSKTIPALQRYFPVVGSCYLFFAYNRSSISDLYIIFVKIIIVYIIIES